MTNHSNADLAIQFRRDYKELGSWDAVGAKHGVTAQYAQKHWYNTKFRKRLPEPEPSTIIDFPQTQAQPEPQPETDHVAWNHTLAALPDVYRVAFLTDMHIPDHDLRAIELACKLVEDFKPHILPDLSDALDFPTISRFETTVEELAQDAFHQIQHPFLSVKRSIRSAAPDAKEPVLPGNHDRRVKLWLQRNAPQFQHTINGLFVDMVRKGGGLWLGWDMVELELPNLHIIHGDGITRFSNIQYLGRKLWDYMGGQVSAVMGHFHRADMFSKRGAEGTVVCAAIPCLCNLQPKYSPFRSNWEHGVGLITVDKRNTHSVQVDTVRFTRDYAAYWGGKEYRA